ncbi:hypothetical protein [Ensifer aridi]|uniref:hypothetical protein n=1 Tax=Ensifer aridi TaxID=1708715 RepID=UPI00358FD05E
MAQDNKWDLSDAGTDLNEVFDAAKEDGPQLVFDGEGMFTVSYSARGKKGSAKEFLTSGGPDDT